MVTTCSIAVSFIKRLSMAQSTVAIASLLHKIKKTSTSWEVTTRQNQKMRSFLFLECNLGTKTYSSNANGTAIIMLAGFMLPAVTSLATILRLKRTKFLPSVSATNLIWPSMLGATCSLTTPIWNGTWVHLGIVQRVLTLLPVAPIMVGDLAQANGLRTMKIACPQF